MPAMSTRKGAKQDILQKRIPENPKYKNVKPTINTGASLNRYMAKIEEVRRNYKFRKDEIFKRMKTTTFVQLLVQVHRIFAYNYECETPVGELASIAPSEDPTPRNEGPVSRYEGQTPHNEEQMEDNEEQGRRDTSPVPSLAVTEGDYGRGDPETSRSTLLSVSRGIGELDPTNEPIPPHLEDTCPYLLLDIRDKDEYNQCHITTALSYPKAFLSRAVNYESKEMLAYKNRDGKIIVVYDEDERIAHSAATTLVQRGYDNLFMLSGGLKVAAKLFPEGLICGVIPASITGKKPPKNPPPSSALKDTFTDEDINNIEALLDIALTDKSIGSRLSQHSTAASSRASSRSTTLSVSSKVPASLAGRPAFR